MSFLQLKEVLAKAPLLRGPNWGLLFHVHIDASDYVVGVVLGHKIDSIEHVIYFISKNFQGVEFNYTITEKELLAVIYALNKLRHYITRYKIFVHINHSSIKYFINKPTILGRLAH